MTTTPPVNSVADRVRDLIRSWRGGQHPDAAAAAADPEVRAQPSLVVDLAYEEFCLREAAGESPDISRFCARFDALRSEIRDVLEGHRILASRPDILAQASWPEVGEVWGELQFARDLGRGAFARVYVVADRAIGRPVVLKLSRRASGEGRSLGRVSHPHIVDVLWSRNLHGFQAMAMPFEATATLRRAIDAAFVGAVRPRRADALLRAAGPGESGWPVRSALLSARQGYVPGVLRVAGKLAESLAHARTRGISHGDLKPTNVLIAPGGHPLLIDFNLATAAEDAATVVGGTVAYASPERLRAMLNPAEPVGDAEASDVYSFGLILHECLTGTLPVAVPEVEDVREAIRRAIGSREVLRPGILPAVPRAVSDLVGECLATNPEQRPTFQGVADRLARYARPPRRVTATAIACVAMLLLAVTLVATLGQGPTREPIAPRTAEEFTSRGRSFLARGQTASALSDFQTAAELRPAAREVATLAYALAMSAQHEKAIAMSERAFRFPDFREPWALNNYAAALVAFRHKIRADMDRADDCLSEVIARLPASRAAQYNRAMARFWADLDPVSRMLVNDRCLADIAEVMAGEPVTALLCVDAARLYAAAPGEANAARAVGFAAESIRLGTTRSAVIGNSQLKHRFLRLAARDVAILNDVPQGPSRPAIDIRWLSPFAD